MITFALLHDFKNSRLILIIFKLIYITCRDIRGIAPRSQSGPGSNDSNVLNLQVVEIKNSSLRTGCNL